MHQQDIETMFVHIRDFLTSWAEEHQLTFYWHGGEPFAQPVSYWKDILQRQRKVFGTHFVKKSIVNSVQTNATLLTEKHLPLLRHFRIGFSFDVINDHRVNVAGKSTTEVVKQKINWLRANGINTAGIVVISTANVNKGKQVIDYYLQENLCVRILHLDEGLDQIPQIRPVTISFHDYLQFLEQIYGLPEVQEALNRGLRIEPISLARHKLERCLHGDETAATGEDLSGVEYLLEVDTNGEVYSPADYPYRNSYGNIFRESIDQLLESEGRKQRIERSKERLEKVCDHCLLFRKACNGTFVSHATPEQYVEIEQSGGCYLKFLAELMMEDSRLHPA
jgi:radical SAM protein with 4Fe4S-binding SPASM domain